MLGRSRSKKNSSLRQSSSGFNYYRNGQGAPKLRTSKKYGAVPTESIKHAAQRLSLRAGLIIAIAAFIYWGLTLTPNTKLVIGGGQYRTADNYQRVIDKYISATRDRTKLTFDSQSIVSALKKDFPEIASAEVELPIIGRNPVIRLDVSSPAAIVETGKGKFVMSSSGVLIDEIHQLLPINDLPILKNSTGADLGNGSIVLSPSQVDFLRVISAQCKKTGVGIKYFKLPAIARELDLYINGKPYYVKLDLGRDPLEQIGSYIATSKHLDSHKLKAQQYIDVRVAGKVYYR